MMSYFPSMISGSVLTSNSKRSSCFHLQDAQFSKFHKDFHEPGIKGEAAGDMRKI